MTEDVADRENEGAITQNRNPSYHHLSWLRLPAPVKSIFDRFPLVTYDRNELPPTRAGSRRLPTLYVFTTDEDARAGAPSFNPTCLKWQAYLHFCGIRFVTHPSSNHASPSGALPFLFPTSDQGARSAPIATKQLRAWAEREGNVADVRESKGELYGNARSNQDGNTADLRYEAYASLLDNRIRSAYLHTLYLCTSNFNTITRPLYIESITSSSTVRFAQAHQLRKIARLELLKQSTIIDAEAIYRECNLAFEALSILLKESPYFFGKESPGLLDAAVFGYTNLFLDENLKWKETRMRDVLEGYENLVSHRKRILENFFSVS